MGKIGYGYGSEWHLLRWLGRHRKELSEKILIKMKHPESNIVWIDFLHAASPKPLQRDREYTGISFLSPSHPIHLGWKSFWPASGNSQNWDAIGQLQPNTAEPEWLLVEAKAHTEEIKSDCGATSKQSIDLIEHSFNAVKSTLGVPTHADWLKQYYQYANRLATLHFLRKHGIKAHLVFIYFCGDSNPSGTCPSDARGWAPALERQDTYLELPPRHSYSDFIHKIFLNV